MRADIDSVGETTALSLLDLVAADLASTSVSGTSPRFRVNPSHDETILYLDESGAPLTPQNARFRIHARRIGLPQPTSPRLFHLRAVWPANDMTSTASRVEIITAF